MNFKKFINSDYLKSNPLCGISTYKDELNLATGACTRKIKKVVLDGTEEFIYSPDWGTRFVFTFPSMKVFGLRLTPYVSTHYQSIDDGRSWQDIPDKSIYSGSDDSTYKFFIKDTDFSSASGFANYLRQQYANGTPVTVWYILETPTTETITVPSGLSGTEEGYLNQSGTPTPTNPIYPTANTVEKWFDINHYIMGTSTDTITTLPAVLYPTGTTAIVGLKGQAVQSSTPTPDNPIMPEGTGERTGNLFNVNRQASNTWTIDNKYYIDGTVGDNKSSIRPDTVDVSISNSGDLTVTARSYYGAGFVVAVTPNTTHTISFTTDKAVPSSKSIATITYVNADEDFLNYITIYGDTTSVTFTTPNTAYYILITFRHINDTLTYSDIMLNLGSIPLPYEPYGYKIPILNNSQTTNVYLGETESTRRIKKLVLTGEETIRLQSINEYNIANFYISLLGLVVKDGLSSHFEKQTTIIGQTQTEGYFLAYSAQDTTLFIRISVSRASTTTEMQTWLSNQYTNGTPVTFWYTTEEPTTGIVNEPIRKIGDYADEVSNISIPTIAGANTVDVLTTLKPSEVSVNYHGWHPIADVYKRESGQWD